MGGAEVLTYASTGPAATRARIRGYLAESPFCGLSPASRPSQFTVLAGRLAAHVLPNMRMVQALDANLLSRDPAVCERFRRDALCHDTGTLEGLAGMLDRAANLEDGSVTMKGETAAGKSIWVAHGNADGICDFEITRKWTMQAEVEDKEFKEYDGWYHRCTLTARVFPCFLLTSFKVHSEPSPDKETYVDDVVKWIFARLD